MWDVSLIKKIHLDMSIFLLLNIFVMAVTEHFQAPPCSRYRPSFLSPPFFLSIFFALLSLLCATKAPPKLVKKYPDVYYIRGIGEETLREGGRSECLRRAEDLAIANIAKQIKVEVTQVIIDFWEQETGKKIKAEERGKFEVIAELKTKAVLEGVKIADKAVDERRKVCYVLAVLPRETTAKNLTEKIREILGSIEEKLKEFERQKAKGRITQALALLFDVRKELSEAISLKGERNVILGPLLELPSEIPKEEKEKWISISKIDSKVYEIFDRLSLQKISEVIEGERGKALKEPIYLKVTFQNIPVEKFPLKVKFEKGKGVLDENILTDKEGIALFRVSFIDPVSPSPTIIRVYPDIKKIVKEEFLEMAKILKAKYLEFEIRLPKEALGDLQIAILTLIGELEKIQIETKVKIKTKMKIPLFVEDFTLKGKLVGGEFSAYFTDKLKEMLAKSERFKVVTKIIPSEEIYFLKGSYWKLKDYLEIRAQVESWDGKVISSSSVRLLREAIEGLGLSLSPKTYGEGVEVLTEDFSTSPEIEVKIWTDRGRNAIFKEGEEIKFNVLASKDCYIYVVDFQSSGEVVMLVPNIYDKRNRIEGGRVYKIPDDIGTGYKFVITPPFGTDVIKVFVSEREMDIEEVLRAMRGSRFILDSEASKEFLSEVRERFVTERGIGVIPKYSESSVVITTVPR